MSLIQEALKRQQEEDPGGAVTPQPAAKPNPLQPPPAVGPKPTDGIAPPPADGRKPLSFGLGAPSSTDADAPAAPASATAPAAAPAAPAPKLSLPGITPPAAAAPPPVQAPPAVEETEEDSQLAASVLDGEQPAKKRTSPATLGLVALVLLLIGGGAWLAMFTFGFGMLGWAIDHFHPRERPGQSSARG